MLIYFFYSSCGKRPPFAVLNQLGLLIQDALVRYFTTKDRYHGMLVRYLITSVRCLTTSVRYHGMLVRILATSVYYFGTRVGYLATLVHYLTAKVNYQGLLIHSNSTLEHRFVSIVRFHTSVFWLLPVRFAYSIHSN